MFLCLYLLWFDWIFDCQSLNLPIHSSVEHRLLLMFCFALGPWSSVCHIWSILNAKLFCWETSLYSCSQNFGQRYASSSTSSAQNQHLVSASGSVFWWSLGQIFDSFESWLSCEVWLYPRTRRLQKTPRKALRSPCSKLTCFLLWLD